MISSPSFKLLSRTTGADVVGIFIALVLTFAVCVGVLGPLNARSRRISAQLQATARERQRFAGVVTSLKHVSDDVNKMQKQLATSPLHMLPKEALNQRLADLTTLAEDCGLSIQAIKPEESVSGGRFVVIPIRIVGRGSYPSCTLFIHQLHEKIPDVGVCRFKLSASPDDSRSASSFDLDLQWLTAPSTSLSDVPRVASSD